MNKYCIRDDYKENKINLSFDEKSGRAYWTYPRVKISERYQYYVYREACRLAKVHGLKSVVDIGCGVATKLNLFFDKNFEIFGIDQKSAIEICKKLHKRGVYIEENFDNPEFKLKDYAAHVDMLICSDVIEHVEDPDKLLEYIKQAASYETFIVISTPERELLEGKDAVSPANLEHIREWSSVEFRQYLQSSGFKILKHVILPLFKVKIDVFTFTFCVNRIKKRLPFKCSQMVVCKKLS